MLNRNRNCFLLPLLVVPIVCAAQNTARPTPYPDSEKGLRDFLKDLIKEVKRGNEARFAEIASDLALPGQQEWFPAVFGDELGQEMAVSYANLLPQIQKTLSPAFREWVRMDSVSAGEREIEQ